jgi:hypothetical protein
MRSRVCCAAMLVAASWWGVAGAHELSCDKTVDGLHVETITSYPVTLRYSVTVANAHPHDASEALAAGDALFSQFTFNPVAPFTLGVGKSATDTFDLVVNSQADCLRLAALDGTQDQFIDNTFIVTWDLGSADCRARVECGPPACSNSCVCDNSCGNTTGTNGTTGTTQTTGTIGTTGTTQTTGTIGTTGTTQTTGAIGTTGTTQTTGTIGTTGTPGTTATTGRTGSTGTTGTSGSTGSTGSTGTVGTGATRTIGFYKTHESALQQCLDLGPIDLGTLTVSTLDHALGILWGSPSRFPDNTPRTGLDQARFLLQRQTLAGICNQRLFGTQPVPSTLLADAVAAISGTDCTLILSLQVQVDAYNNSGDANPFPAGFVPGAATPIDARSRATDPTTPSHMTCQ